MQFKRTKVALSVSLCVALASAAAPLPVFADSSEEIQARVDDAFATLQGYSNELELAQNKLYALQVDLDSTKTEIAQAEEDIAKLQSKLEEGQAKLSDRLSDTYKSGSASLLSVVLGASSFEDLVNNVFYANRIADHDSELLNEVKQTQAQLEKRQQELKEQEAKQQQLVDDQASVTSDAQSKVAEQQAYYNGLDSELQAQLAAEAEARRKADEVANADNSNQGGDAGNGGATNPGGGQGNGGSNNNGSNNGGGSNNNGGGSNGGSGNGGGNTNSGNSPSAAVNFAMSKIGCGYQLGAAGPNVFDCSGLTSWAYAQAGISIPHSSQAQCNMVKSAGHLVTNASYLKPGDLVFWGSGGSSSSIYHVALYIGGGQVVHATNPYYGVIVTGLFQWDGSNFVGGGSPI